MNKLEIANEILRQLGGARALSLMTGANSFVTLSEGYGLQFCIKAIGRPRINKIRIELVNDLYNIKCYFITRRASSWDAKPVASAEGIYCDQLISSIEQMTGLCLIVPRFAKAAA